MQEPEQFLVLHANTQQRQERWLIKKSGTRQSSSVSGAKLREPLNASNLPQGSRVQAVPSERIGLGDLTGLDQQRVFQFPKPRHQVSLGQDRRMFVTLLTGSLVVHLDST